MPSMKLPMRGASKHEQSTVGFSKLHHFHRKILWRAKYNNHLAKTSNLKFTHVTVLSTLSSGMDKEI